MLKVKKLKVIFLSLLIIGGITSCKKESQYIYDVNDVNVSQPGTNKGSVKSTTEFISIVYSDLFGKNISKDELLDLTTAYAGFGDNKLIEDMIIRNFLKKPGVNIPTQSSMLADASKFVNDIYKKLYNREANEFESWYLEDLIKKEANITPELIYYAMLTSDEYRYY